MNPLLKQYLPGSVIKEIEKYGTVIPDSYMVVLNNLYKAEGGLLHLNPTELDITTAYGIYKHNNPNALIFTYIDSIARAQGITAKSSRWTADILNKINSLIDKELELFLSYLFYADYYKGVNLELFDKSLVLLVCNLYANSQVLFWKAVQESLLDMSKQGVLDIPLKELSTVDGKFGIKTSKALTRLLQYEKVKSKQEYILIIKLFRYMIINAMKSEYIGLALKNQDKYMIYLNGWDNRLEDVEVI